MRCTGLTQENAAWALHLRQNENTVFHLLCSKATFADPAQPITAFEIHLIAIRLQNIRYCLVGRDGEFNTRPRKAS